MNKTLILLLALLAPFISLAQKTTYTNLSHAFNFTIQPERQLNEERDLEIKSVKVLIFSKQTSRLIQTIAIGTNFLFSNNYSPCVIRSYITGKNKNIEAIDNDYGDFIIADFNFDGKDDLALKVDGGGNAGPSYVYYIQVKKGVFEKNSFLSDKMEFFPIEIDSISKQLITHVHVSAYTYNEHVYSYNTKTKRWNELRSTIRKA